MKKVYFKVLGVVLLWAFGFTPDAVLAQNCQQPLGLAKNTEFVFQVTDKGRNKGTLNNKVVQQVTDEDGVLVTTFKSARRNKDNRPETSDEYHIRCSGDTIYLDAMLLLREQVLKAFEGKDFDFTPVDIAYPQQMKVGQKLPDGKLGVKVRSSTVNITQISMLATDRKVEALEKITTPAGTFDCYKISYNYEVELDAMGMPLRDVFKVEEYFSLEHGLIKCQFYTKRGKKAKGMELISKRNTTQALKK
ncbi:TapB family protein [Rufibacter latericius]|uniref:DUF3108 domain-containing protein n=1 Tax=Rufibacter latericius TaxID=2487040 RepID=A0A3M9MB26_9BACT|nr:hypothetical protein [Rufibacter latericius]RNI22367.1 hypothetical protein EFB08_19840 [Rufibacter latericius]